MNDPLYGNKVAAALLIVLLLAVGLPVVVGTFSELASHAGEHHPEESAEGCPEGVVFAPFDCSALGEASAGDEGPQIPFVNVLAEASAERGERSAAVCGSCHSFDQGGANGTGPNLWGVVNRPVASVAGFAYSSALQGLGGEWTYERLDPYLENSQGYVSGTAMQQKIRKDEKRADIIAYLGTLASTPVPLPEPVAVEAPQEEGAEGEADGDTAMEETGEAAADAMDFEAAGPGEAVRTDQSEVNNPGDDGFPGDPAKTGSNYTSSNEDGAEVDGDAEDAGFRDEGGLPDEDAAAASQQRSAPDEPGGEMGGGSGADEDGGAEADPAATQFEGGE